MKIFFRVIPANAGIQYLNMIFLSIKSVCVNLKWGFL